MRSPTQAILWEITARNRWALTFAFGAMPMCGILVALTRWYLAAANVPRHSESGDAAPLVIAAIVTVLAALLSLTCIFWSFTFTHIDERGRHGGFPVRLFTLPVKTRTAAAPGLLAGIAAIVMATVIWAALLFILLRENGGVPWLRFVWQLLVLATAFVVMQAIIWLMHPLRFARMVVVACAGLAFLWLFFWPPEVDFYHKPVLFFAGGGLGFVAAIGAAFGVVAWERGGGWQNVCRVGALLVLSGRNSFASASSAQIWFECRRKQCFSASIIGLGMSFALFVCTVPQALMMQLDQGLRVVEMSFMWVLPLGTFFLTAALGGAFGKSDPWGPDITMSSFHAVRPMTTARLVIAKWWAAAQAIVLAWGIFFISSLALGAFWGDSMLDSFWPQFGQAHPAVVHWITHPVVLPTILLLHWHTLVGSMSVVLSGNRRCAAIAGWVGIISFSVLVVATTWFVKRPDHFELWRPVLPWIAAALALLKACCALIVFARARHGLLSRNQFIAMLLLWCALLLGIGASTLLALSYNAVPRELIWFTAVWFMPSGEMPASVIHLASNRHR